MEIIFADDQKTIMTEKNIYFEGLLQRKFLYHHNQITKVFDYEYDNQGNCIGQKEYDYDIFCQTFFYYKDSKKSKKRKRKKVGFQ